jgi:hypothetical protein
MLSHHETPSLPAGMQRSKLLAYSYQMTNSRSAVVVSVHHGEVTSSQPRGVSLAAALSLVMLQAGLYMRSTCLTSSLCLQNPTEDVVEAQLTGMGLHDSSTYTFGQVAHLW